MAIKYVDGDNGNDGNDGSTETLAKATINGAIAVAAADDTIYVQNNGATVYAEQVECTITRVAIIGYGSTIADGVKAVITGSDTRDHGITFAAATSYPQHLLVRNIEIKDTVDHGFEVTQGGRLLLNLYNLDIHDCGGDGLYCSGQTFGRIIRCRFKDNTSDGLWINSNPSLAIALCEFLNNGAYGIKINSTNEYGAGCSMVMCAAAANGSGNVANVQNMFFCTLDDPDAGDNWEAVQNGYDALGRVIGNYALGCGFTNAAAYNIDFGNQNEGLILNNCGFYTATSGHIYGSADITTGNVVDGNPSYDNAATYDFGLGASSPWKQQACKVGDLDNGVSSGYPDIGAVQLEVTGGGGILRRLARLIGG